MQNELTVLESFTKDISDERVEQAQRLMLRMPQVECPVIHRFGPGVYIREVTVPAGTLAIGHCQRFEQMNIMLKGKVTVVTDDGELKTLTAPTCFVGKPGRKVGYIHEEMVWQNIYATNETDVEKLEAMFLDKSESWARCLEAEKLLQIPYDADREDYALLLEELGVNESAVRAETERTDDMIDLPHGSYKIKVGDSPIEGKGLFATSPIEAGELIAPMRIGNKRTIAGRYTNHSANPNAYPVRFGDTVDLFANRPIGGCRGGHDGEEITINYREALKIALEFNKEDQLCQV